MPLSNPKFATVSAEKSCELRVRGTGYRVYFGQDGPNVVILLGGTKKRQQRDIDAAHAYWRDYKARTRTRHLNGIA